MSKKKKRLYFRTLFLSIISVLLGYVFYSNFFQNENTLVVEGDIAPNFQLETLEGETVELNDYRGQGVFLNFWGTYCPPCEEEMPYMDNQYQEYKDKGVEILAVNVGESDLAVERFVDRHNLSFPIPMDEDKAVLDSYGIGPLPTTFLINKDGKVLDILTGGMTEKDIKGYMERIEPS
ncbi:thiol-disulfide oxidoreductase ResA [Salibacterium salarium]|uniref:Thiol-disulfide oxidoreductase ResA n=1 Tax=Salibacterium salarium TaxID=284579 RepID=A0A428MUL4_9BACI|nr:thiol-disulfide oxidoreductase ResA [Salibacterium salarium]RSL29835.1 thiol-disulfide oxidoreductase ResA [Salibacterium salarium]